MAGMIEFYNLEKTPNCARDKTHYYCDYVELLALINGIDGVSNSDVYDRFLEDDKISDIGSLRGSEQNESWVSEIDRWFGEIEARSVAYGDSYPFFLDDRRVVRKSNISDFQKIYVGLLLCSSMRNISNSSILSSAFEYASFCAMKNYLPPLSEVHLFGVSSGVISRYSGSLESKIKKLSEDTGYRVSSRKNLFRRIDNGDGGADIVAWIPFGNDINRDKKLFFVGQSASTMRWPEKQLSGARLKTYLDIENTVMNVLYVPYDMRDYDRDFKESGQITTDILFDRHRMINLLTPDDLFSNDTGVEFKAAIDFALDFEEDIV